MGFPKPVDARLTAPLTLPAESGKPLTTQGGITLDDGSGGMSGIAVIEASSAQIDYLTSENGSGAPWFSHGMNVDGLVGFVNAGGGNLSSGTGAPTIAGTAGDFFLRTDTPTTTNQRIYVCTVSGAAGAATWVGIV